MAAPMVPTTATTVNYAVLAKLKLVPTAIGMRTFMIKFPAALGPLLAETLRNTIQTPSRKSTRSPRPPSKTTCSATSSTTSSAA